MVLVAAVLLLSMLVSTVVRRFEGAAERPLAAGRTATRQMNAAPTSDAAVSRSDRIGRTPSAHPVPGGAP